MPKLVPGIITHLGELGPDMINLVETITGAAGKAFRKGLMSRGLSRSKYYATFRTRMKDALLAANAEGFGQALLAAGIPIARWVVPPLTTLIGTPHLPIGSHPIRYTLDGVCLIF